ncbi:MAG: potassium channel family protein [Cyclobacteriaceae bacterium]
MDTDRAFKKRSAHKLKLRRIVLGILLLIFSIIIGVSGFMLLEDFRLLEAFYMTVITVSTVGFTEVRRLSEDGKLFTSFYIIFNLGIFAYAISLITTYIVEGEFRDAFHQYMVSKKLKRMDKHVIVCGFGRNGSKACEELYNSKRPFVLVEQDANLVNSHPFDQHFKYIVGDATLDDTLLSAGIKRAEALITTLPRDTDNVYITLTARELNSKMYIISRATEENAAKKLYRAGADQVVMPDAIGGMHMAQLLTKPKVIEFLNMLTGVSSEHLELEDIRYDELREEFQQQSIRKLNIRQRSGATVIGFKSQQQGFIFNPSEDIQISRGDTIIIIGTGESLKKFKQAYC